MRTDALVGRRLHISALHSAVDAAFTGAGGVVLLAGEPGMGKTALAAEAAEYAKSRGATVRIPHFAHGREAGETAAYVRDELFSSYEERPPPAPRLTPWPAGDRIGA